MPTAKLQPSFAGGVIGPGLHGRVDTARYDIALKVGRNVFIHTHGGVSNRAGFEFIDEVMDSTKLHRLIPFERDDDDNQVMVLGDTIMQIIDSGAYVQDGGDYQTVTPYASADLATLGYVQSVDVVYFASHGLIPQQMSRTSPIIWTFADMTFDPDITAPGSPAATPNAAGSETYTYKVSPIEDGVEGFPTSSFDAVSAEDLAIDGAFNTITWTGTFDEVNIYRERSGVFGFIGFSIGNTFEDDNISPELTVTPVEASGLFGGAGEFPSNVTIADQRLIFANSTDEPETLWMSRIGQYSIFTKSRITQADDRIIATMSGRTINRIRSMIQLRELLVFASKGEFSMNSPDGTLDATNPAQTQFGHSGSINVDPIVLEDTAIFIDRTGRQVRDMRYAFEQDGYSGNDLTIFASHFFEGKQIAGWAYAKNPFNIVWVYLDDGTLLSLTYKREHKVWAWCEHDVGGAIESMAVIPEGNHDALYVIVRRDLIAGTKRYIERLHDREFSETEAELCFFVDSGVTYSGAPATVISGFDHLEGETITALADGDVITDLLVTGGDITLPNAASVVHAGIYNESEIENLPPAIQLQKEGSARGRPTKVTRMFMQLRKTRGIEVSNASKEEYTPFTLTAGDLSQDIDLYTGQASIDVEPDFNLEGTISIRQPHPLPMTILGIAPALTIGQDG